MSLPWVASTDATVFASTLAASRWTACAGGGGGCRRAGRRRFGEAPVACAMSAVPGASSRVRPLSTAARPAVAAARPGRPRRGDRPRGGRGRGRGRALPLPTPPRLRPPSSPRVRRLERQDWNGRGGGRRRRVGGAAVCRVGRPARREAGGASRGRLRGCDRRRLGAGGVAIDGGGGGGGGDGGSGRGSLDRRRLDGAFRLPPLCRKNPSGTLSWLRRRRGLRRRRPRHGKALGSPYMWRSGSSSTVGDAA